MAWEKQIIGYKITGFKEKDIIPADAIFVYCEATMKGFMGDTYFFRTFYYQVPIYKNVRIKFKDHKNGKG